MARTTSLLRDGLFLAGALSLLGITSGGCQLIAGLGGEETLNGGKGGTGGNAGGTGGNTGGNTGGSIGGTGGVGGGTGGTGLTGPCSMGETEDCYSGPAGTEAKGECHVGQAMCTDQGMWGACMNEQVPQAESCAATADENCDDLDCVVWVKTMSSDVRGRAVGVDDLGNIYAAVEFQTGVDFGDGLPVVPVGSDDIALLKYDTDGKLLWKKVYPGTGDQDVETMIVLGDGTMAIAGGSTANVDFGGGITAKGEFVAKLDKDGNALWAKGATGTGSPQITDLAIDSQGNVFAGGNAATIDYGNGMFSGGDAQSFFIVKLGALAGDVAWVRITVGGKQERLGGIGVDPSDSLVITGSFDGTNLGLAQAAPAPVDISNSSGQMVPFLLRLDPAGVTSDSKKLANPVPQTTLNVTMAGIAVDNLGVSTLAAYFTGKIGFSEGTYDAGSDSALLMIRDQTSGFNQMTKPFITAGAYTYVVKTAADGDDNMLLVLNTSSTSDFGGGPVGASKALVKLDKDGNFLWQRPFKLGDGNINGVAAGKVVEQTVLIGSFYTTVDFGTGAGPMAGTGDMFLLKLGK